MTAPQNNYEAGVALYNEPKPEGDRDLVKEVRGIFSDAGVSEEGLQRNYDAHRHISSSKDKVSVVQQVMINRYMDVTLKRSPKSTIQLRAELLANGDMDNWVNQVKTKITPFLTDTRLLER